MSMKVFDTILEKSSAARFERQRQDGNNFRKARVAANLSLTSIATMVGVTKQQLTLFELGILSNLNGKNWSAFLKELEEAVKVLAIN